MHREEMLLNFSVYLCENSVFSVNLHRYRTI